MEIKGAMTVLRKEAKKLDMTVEEVVAYIDASPRKMLINMRVLQAYETYKVDQGYFWSGVNFETWVKKENI